MISTLLSRIVILLLGTLYPAYASYKAVRTKDVKEYVKWMMYWIVFALFTTAETVTDVFLAFWFPFYYELKIIVVLWLLSPATQGSSILYRKFVHPILVKKEQEIDEYLSRATEQGYKTVVELGARGVQYATQVIMQTAIRGGGGLVNQLKKSYSVGDLHDDQQTRNGGNRRTILQVLDESDAPASNIVRGHHQPHLTSLPDVSDSEIDDFNDPVSEPVMRPPMHRAPRTARVTREVYFTEIDSPSTTRLHAADGETDHYIGQVRSVEDISSGYSSTEFLASDPNVGVDAAAGTIPRRSGSTRAARSATRPVTVVLEGANTKGKPASDPPNVTIEESFRRKTNKRRAPPPPTVAPPPLPREGSIVRDSTSAEKENDQKHNGDDRQEVK